MDDYTFAGHCNGTTKAGKRCQHRTIYANGFCKQHGGDSTEFMKERMQKIKAKALARHGRFMRRLERAGLIGTRKGKDARP